MEKLTSKEKNKPRTWLSKKVQNYSKAIVFSVAAILWAQSSDTIADNLLSDSTLQISKPQKETPESIKNNENFVNILSDFIIKFWYENIENKKWLIEAIKQKWILIKDIKYQKNMFRSNKTKFSCIKIC